MHTLTSYAYLRLKRHQEEPKNMWIYTDIRTHVFHLQVHGKSLPTSMVM